MPQTAELLTIPARESQQYWNLIHNHQDLFYFLLTGEWKTDAFWDKEENLREALNAMFDCLNLDQYFEVNKNIDPDLLRFMTPQEDPKPHRAETFVLVNGHGTEWLEEEERKPMELKPIPKKLT